MSSAAKLLSRVRADIEACLKVSTGEDKMTNRVRGFLADIGKGMACRPLLVFVLACFTAQFVCSCVHACGAVYVYLHAFRS